MSRLIRNQVGMFDQESSVSPEVLEDASNKGKLAGMLLPLEKVLEFLPKIRVNDDFIKPVSNGNAMPKSSLKSYPGEFKQGIMMRVCNGGNKVLAIAEALVDQDRLIISGAPVQSD